jgi:RNA polymerase sigma factor (sigma-70 family)
LVRNVGTELAFNGKRAVDDPARMAEHADHLARLSRIISGLAEGERAVARLVMLEDARSQEVSDTLGITSGQVAARLLRARRKIREGLLGQGENPNGGAGGGKS